MSDLVLAAGLAAFLAVGGALAARRPRHPVAWLLIAEGLVWELGMLADATDTAEWILGWIWFPGVIGVPVLVLLFPDGRPPSRRWWGMLAFLVWPPLWPPAYALALASLVVRYRRAGALERRQLAWFAYAGALIAGSQLIGLVVDSGYLNVAPLAALPLAVGVAVERHCLYELERLVSGTVLAAFVALVSVACVALLGGWGAALAALVTAAAVRPLHRRTTKLVYREPEPALSIRTLGGFRVFRDGEPITAWPSKKARTLLKILIARRGRPVAREELMELLWPGEDPAKLGNRLSVALSALRDALGREQDPIRADADAIALDLAVASVDVERLLAADDPVLVERLYGGDFLEEDRYEDWAADLRDQARAAYGAALRTRAQLATSHDEAVRAYLRLLEHDRYDAAAHRDLIDRLEGAGRHGEAIARRRAYIRQMAEIDVVAAF